MFENKNYINNVQIDWSKVLMVNLFFVKNTKSIIKNYALLTSDFFSVLFSGLFIRKFEIKEYGMRFHLYMRTHDRKDIIKFSSFFEEALSDSVIIYFRKKKIDFKPILFIKTLSFVFVQSKTIRNFINISGLSSNCSRYSLWLSVFSVSNTFIRLQPYISNIKTVISFQEMQPEENLVIQFANTLSIRTIGLQHGIYRDEGQGLEIDIKHITKTSYLASVCNEIFVWGEYTANIFRKYTKAKISVIGRPLFLPREHQPGVIIIYDNNEQTNAMLEKISQELEKRKIHVSRWYHPTGIRPEGKSLKDGPTRYNVIGFRSSILAEMGRLNFRVFLLKGSSFEGHITNDIIISDVKSFMKCLSPEFEYPHKAWNHFIEYYNKECLQIFEKKINDLS